MHSHAGPGRPSKHCNWRQQLHPPLTRLECVINWLVRLRQHVCASAMAGRARPALSGLGSMSSDMLIVSLGLLCLPPLGRAGSAFDGHAQRGEEEKGGSEPVSMCGEGRKKNWKKIGVRGDCYSSFCLQVCESGNGETISTPRAHTVPHFGPTPFWVGVARPVNLAVRLQVCKNEIGKQP